MALVLTAECRSTGGARAAVGDASSAGTPLVPDESGRIDVSTTGTSGIRGRWFASADTDDCRNVGKHPASEYSVLVAPDARAPAFKPTEDLGMCAMGVAAKAIAGADGNPDWSNTWGFRIGLTPNDGMPYDALAHGSPVSPSTSISNRLPARDYGSRFRRPPSMAPRSGADRSRRSRPSTPDETRCDGETSGGPPSSPIPRCPRT